MERQQFISANATKILPDQTVLTLQNYDTIYPICWREAMRIAAGTGHLSKKYITDAMVNYPEDDDISRQTLRDSSWAVWKVYTYNRVVYLDAFTGKVTFKGYLVSGYITEPDGGCSAFLREQKEPPKPTPSPSKPKIKRDNWLYYLLLHLHLL